MLFSTMIGNTPVIIGDKLFEVETIKLITVLEKHHSILGYSLQDLEGISPTLCTHRIPNADDQNWCLVTINMDHVSKWVEAMPCRAAGAQYAKKMLQETIFPQFGIPRLVNSDGGPHFIGKKLLTLFDRSRNLAQHRYTIPPLNKLVRQKPPRT